MAHRRRAFLIALLWFALPSIVGLEPASRFSLLVWAANLVVYLLSLHVAVLAHELAHAVAARTVGLRPYTIDIGFGQPVLQRVLFGTLFVLRPLPSGGITAISSPTQGHIRKRFFVTLAAGPLCSVLMASLTMSAGPMGDFRTRAVPLAAFCLANLFAASSVLPIPHPKPLPGEPPGSDAWQMLTLPARSDQDVQQMFLANPMADALIALAKKDSQAAIAASERWSALLPDKPEPVLMRASATLQARDYTRARELFETVLNRRDAGTYRSLIQNCLAWTYVMLGDRSLLGEADALTLEALSDKPGDASFLDTRGFVLLELGRVSEAVPLLTRAARRSDRAGRANSICGLAIASARQGRLDEARRHLREAERLDPENEMLERARQECRPSPSMAS